jgi:hypothetical protein
VTSSRQVGASRPAGCDHGGVAILVDAPRWRHDRDGHRFAHLASDASRAELDAFVAALHLGRSLRFHGDHYDLPVESWDAVVARGAAVVTTRELIRRLRQAGLRRNRR